MQERGGALFLQREYIEGTPLNERLLEGPLETGEAIAVGVALFSALAELHSRGVLHRAVAPSNVILARNQGLRGAVLIDAGLGRTERVALTGESFTPQHARYVSPEEAGTLSREVGPSADLYSAGVVLFECLNGSPPFDGETVGDVLRRHLSAHPPRLRALGCDVPRALEEMLVRLLQKEPSERYQTAAAALADLQEIGAKLAEGDEDPPVVIGRRDRRGALAEPPLVGRRRELAMFSAALRGSFSGEGGLVLLESESGGGKTRLMSELALISAQRGARVFWGQAQGQAPRRPFQLLSGIVETLLSEARANPEWAEALRVKLGEAREPICEALPELSEALRPAVAGRLGPEAYASERTLTALRHLLTALGEPSHPAIVLLDDGQWADPQTLELLSAWHSRLVSSKSRAFVLLVIANRPEERPEMATRLKTATRIQVEPLTEDESRALVESMLGVIHPSVVARVTQVADGNAFMVGALLEGMLETGALAPSDDGWRTDQEKVAEVTASRRAADLLERKFDRLPRAVLQALGTGAVLGRTFDASMVAALQAQLLKDTSLALELARGRRIVVSERTPLQYTFVHDRLREALLARMSPMERRQLHARAAEYLRRLDEDRALDLAFHFDAAGEPEKALTYALEAAVRTRAQHALSLAEQYYEIADRGGGTADRSTRLQIVEGLADVRVLLGRYPEALEAFERALLLCEGRLERARIQGKMGDLAFKRGDMHGATAAIERALRTLGRRVPRTRAAFIVLCAWEALFQLLHTVLPRVFIGRRSAEGADAERQAIRLYYRLQYPYFFARSSVAMMWTHLRMLNLAERYPPTPELAQAYSSHAVAMSTLPKVRRAIRYGRRGVELNRELGSLWALGVACEFLGIALFTAARYSECLKWSREASRLLERAGDPWETNNALGHIARSLYCLGDLPGAEALARRRWELATEVGDRLAAGRSLEIWAKSTEGDVPAQPIEALRQDVGGNVLLIQYIAQADALRCLREGRVQEAVEQLDAAWQRVRSAHLQRSVYVAGVPTLLSTALRQAAQQAGADDPGRARAFLNRARSASREATRWGRRYLPLLPPALRESARVAIAHGHVRRARKLLGRSLAAASRQSARYEQALTLEAFAELGRVFAWPGTARNARLAAEMLQTLRPRSAAQGASELEPTLLRPTVAMADRFATLLEAGRKIALTLDGTAVFESVREAMVALLRPEQCFVLVRTKEGELQPWPPQAAVPSFSIARAREAEQSGRPVTFSEDDAANEAERHLLDGIRSGLCAPILMSGRTAAVIYATHGQVSGLFGEPEKRVAQFITTLAGAALENTEGFRQVQKLSEERARLHRQAQEAIHARDEFLAIASHELRTPITALRLQLEMIRRLPARALGRHLEIAEKQAQKLTALVGSLLEVSRISSADTPLERTRVRLGEVVREVVGLYRAEADRAGSQIVVRDDPRAEGNWDRARIQQVVVNLLSNAIKYGPGQPIEIQVEQTPSGARLSVKDRGIGIRPEDVARIFDRFERAVSMRHYGGLGLGLFIARRIVEAHGGTVRVESEPGRGSTFTIDLPA